MPPHTTVTDIPYTLTNSHSRQILDLHLPIPPNPSEPPTPPPPTPLIIYIHGGAFKFGSKESSLLPTRQLQNGYTIASLNYRRSGEAIFPAMIQDCKSAIRFLKSPSIAAKYNIDPTRVVVWGESAGGHATAFLGTTSQGTPGGKYDVGDYLDIPSSVNGVVDYYGPTDFLAMDAHLPEGFQTHENVDSPESLYLGGKISEIPDVVSQANPCTYVETLARQAVRPRFFVAHGRKDRIVPEYVSRLLVETLRGYDVDVEYLGVDGADHVFEGISEEQQAELDRRTDQFLRRVFGG